LNEIGLINDPHIDTLCCQSPDIIWSQAQVSKLEYKKD